MIKKLPAITPSARRQKDDVITEQLKKVIRRGVGYTLVGTRPFGTYRFRKSLYPPSCHSTVHQVVEILVANQLGVPLDTAIQQFSHQQPCQYRREMTGGRYLHLSDIRSLTMLSGTLYQMVSGQRFNEGFYTIELFSALPEIVNGITELMMTWESYQVIPDYPLSGAMKEMNFFPPLYFSENTIWMIGSRRMELKRIDLFYPIVAYFLAKQRQKTPWVQVGVINPYTGQYAVLNMDRFSPGVYKQLEQLIDDLSS